MIPSLTIPAGLRLPTRLSILGTLFLVELLAISLWLDAEVLRGQGFLATLVHDWGAWTVKLGVAIVLGSLIFAESKAENGWARISEDCSTHEINWTLLGAHLAGMTLFVWLSSVVFQHAHSGISGNALMLTWALTGVAALALAACALIPMAVWADIFRATGDAWIYAIGGALVACTLGILAQKLWLPLSHWTLDLSATMLRPFVGTMVRDPATMMLGTPTFNVEISPQCSGYEGMGLILAFSSAWLWFFRKQWRFPQALILLPAGVAVMFIVNAMRIAGLILIGNAGAPQVAAGGFHSQAGWLAFNVVAIGTCLIARRIPLLVIGEPKAASVQENPTVPYLMPFLAILFAAIVARMMSSSFDWFYALRVIAAAGAVWTFRASYKNLDFSFGPLGIAAGAAVFAMWITLEPRSAHAPMPEALSAASSSARYGWIAFRVIGAVIFVPIAEELAFRGFLLRRLADADFEMVGWKTFAWAPLLISSIAFGILHGERWIAGTIAGLLFAVVQIRKGRIGEAIAAHAVANALVAAWVLGTSTWQLW